MLTRAAPAINRSLAGTMDQGQLAQFMSSVAMCSQPLEHRSAIAVNKDSAPFGLGGEQGGVYSENGWNPSDYPGLFPQFARASSSTSTFVDIANSSNYRAGDWYSNFYAGPEFDLRTNLTQTMNQYFAQNHYGGNALSVSGNTSTTNLTAGNVLTENITANSFNNFPVTPGQSGPQGDRGQRGEPGAPGQAANILSQVAFVENSFNPGALIREITRLNQVVNQIWNDLLNLKLALQNIRATPQGIKFDPETCSLVPEVVNIEVTVPGL